MCMYVYTHTHIYIYKHKYITRTHVSCMSYAGASAEHDAETDPISESARPIPGSE